MRLELSSPSVRITRAFLPGRLARRAGSAAQIASNREVEPCSGISAILSIPSSASRRTVVGFAVMSRSSLKPMTNAKSPSCQILPRSSRAKFRSTAACESACRLPLTSKRKPIVRGDSGPPSSEMILRDSPCSVSTSSSLLIAEIGCPSVEVAMNLTSAVRTAGSTFVIAGRKRSLGGVFASWPNPTGTAMLRPTKRRSPSRVVGAAFIEGLHGPESSKS